MTTSLLELFSANDATLDLLAEIDPQGREANPAIKLSNGKLEDLAKQLCTGFARRSPAGYGMANLLLLEGRDSFPQGSWAWGLDLGWLPDSDPCPWVVADVLPRSRQGVEERGLAGVGVAGQGDGGDGFSQWRLPGVRR